MKTINPSPTLPPTDADAGGLYREMRHSLLAYIESKVSDKQDAEDILQNVFVKIASDIRSLSGKDNVRNWIFTITRNAVIDYYRTHSGKKPAPLDDNWIEGIVEESAPDTTQGLEACMDKMIAMLPEEYKGIIQDAELNGVRQKELAEKYAMPYPSLRSRVQRGRERLKNLLHECCRIETDTQGNILDAEPRSVSGGICTPQKK